MCLFLFILFVAVNASVRQTIKNSVHSHAYLRNVDAICEVVMHRLAINGIYLKKKTDCTHVNITSTMASTLDELYDNFEKTDVHNLKTQLALLLEKHTECRRKCNIELLFDGPIKYWVERHIVPVNFDDCWPECDFDIPIGSLEMNEEAFEPCLTCLGESDAAAAEYNRFKTEFIQYEALLSKEIALVWRFQMPEILEKKASSSIIKY